MDDKEFPRLRKLLHEDQFVWDDDGGHPEPDPDEPEDDDLDKGSPVA